MILTLGDSVTWGQGLLDNHKFDRVFASGGPLSRVAHSGAVVGSEQDTSSQKVHPEIPVPYPSIWQQIESVGDWSDIDAVILNGGINDVSLTRILNPWIQADQISQLSQQFCGAAVTALLASLASRLKSGARVLVIGYYPILSQSSNPDNEKQLRMLMEMHGVATASVATETTVDIDTILPRIIDNCLTFWTTSKQSLTDAVNRINQTIGHQICTFVDPGFTEANSLWASDPMLWELTPELDAEDEVTTLRNAECQAEYGDLVHLPEWGQWYICCRASVGHPNVQGAQQIAEKLTAAPSL